MLLYLFYHVLQPYFHALNVFRYITVRTALASLTALLITLVLGPWVIQRLRDLQIGQFIREEGPKSHQAKAGTPTMGGVLIVGSTVIPTLLWGDLENDYVWGGARNISDVPSVLVERLQHYFLTYKLVPGQRVQTRIASVYGRAHAFKVVRAAMADYDDTFGL